MGIETALIGGGAMLGSALLGADAAKDAGRMQAGATEAGIAEQRRQFDLARADQAPWLQTGQQSIRTIGDLLRNGSIFPNFTGADLTNEPGYAFRLAEGNKAIENAARARGMFMSPATVKELMRYGQDFASGEFQNAFNRDMANKTTKFNMLSGAAGTGQTAANALANAGANSANTIGQLVTQGANARGAAGIAGANAISGGIGQGVNMWNQDRMLGQILNRGGFTPVGGMSATPYAGGYGGWNT